MRVLLFWVLIGTLAACGSPPALPRSTSASETAGSNSMARQAEATPPTTIPTSSPLPPPTSIVGLHDTTPLSPLPTPTAFEAATPIVPAETKKQMPDKLTGAMGEAVIIYRRSGGFRGTSDQWAIYPDGRITASDGRQRQVTSQQVEQALSDIDTLGFFDMSGRYISGSTCCDRFTHEITVHRGDKVNTVTTIDVDPSAPPELWQIIDKINRLVSKARTS
jgi:hypothetical protein